MRLFLAKAIGRGSTPLAAFDAALVGTGGLFVEHEGVREQDGTEPWATSGLDGQHLRELVHR